MINTLANHAECEFPSGALSGSPLWHFDIKLKTCKQGSCKGEHEQEARNTPRSWLCFFKNRWVEAWNYVPDSAHYLFKSFQLCSWVGHADRWGNWDRGDLSKSTQLVVSKARARFSCANCSVLLRNWPTPLLHLLSLLLYWGSQDLWEHEPLPRPVQACLLQDCGQLTQPVWTPFSHFNAENYPPSETWSIKSRPTNRAACCFFIFSLKK